MTMKRVVWFVNRLSVMSLQELIHRVTEVSRIKYAKFFNNRAKIHFQSSSDFLDKKVLVDYSKVTSRFNWDISPDDIELVLLNKYKVQSFIWEYKGQKSWLTCPELGIEWAQLYFGDIDYRSGGKKGDVRIVWEASRLQQLTVLAYIANLDSEHSSEALANYLEQFNNWHESNPPYIGPHYISVMECAIRVISLCIGSSILGDKIQENIYWTKQSNIVTSHAEIILERLSLHSSSGNHTLSEAAGLIFAAKFYGNHERAKVWLKVGQDLFLKEFMRQTYSDGSGLEQTNWYLKFIYDLAKVTVPLIDNRLCQDIDDRLGVIEQYLADIKCNNSLASYGDSDSGYAINPFVNFVTKPISQLEGYKLFVDSGLVKIQRKDMTVFFDVGNLGMPPSYGHGHADSLSVQVFHKGQCILSDTGTGTYNGSDELRRYFRSTAAHNTVVINKADQSVQSSRFMWKSDIKSVLIDSSDSDIGTFVLAKHDGYKERYNCVHYRGVFVSLEGELYIWDYVEGTDYHADLYWHFDEGISVSSSKVIGTNSNLNMHRLSGEEKCYFNNKDVPAGITSPSYGEIVPCYTLEVSYPHGINNITYFGESKSTAQNLENVKNYFLSMLENGVRLSD